MSATAEVQKLEPNALVELFQLDGTDIGGSVLYFHANTVYGPIWWRGVKYEPWPFKATGFARTSEKQPVPKLVVANLEGTISQLCLQFQDMVGAKITRVRTFSQFLDDENFRGPNLATTDNHTFNSTGTVALQPVANDKAHMVSFVVAGITKPIGIRLSGGVAYGPIDSDGVHAVSVTSGAGADTLVFYPWTNGDEQAFTLERVHVQEILGNPTADPNEQLPPEVWFIDRKSGESNESVEFELASAFDLNGVRLPRRQIIANYCSWRSTGGYRGPYCGYTGPPVAKRDGTPTADMYDDDCGGKLSDCKLREWPEDQLGFGGFPAAGLVRT